LKIVEISKELKKELATKYDLKILEVELTKEIDLVRKNIKIMEIRLIAIIVIINITFNSNTLELLGKLFWIIK